MTSILNEGKKKFKAMVLGGTFDKLHDGHYHLLNTASSLANSISIGLTSTNYQELYPKKYKEKVFSYVKRLEQLIKFINELNLNINYYIFPINHPWKNESSTNPFLDSIIVSEETSSSIKLINNKRTENNLKPLKAVVISGVVSKKGTYLSSTALRKKLIK